MQWWAIGAATLALAAPAAGQDRPSASRASAVRGNIAQYFDDDAYPTEAIRAGEQGRVSVRLSVAVDGQVTACTVTGSSGSASLDATTCRIALTRIAFTPANDEGGRAIASTYPLAVRWVLPRRAVEPRATNGFTIALDIAADGKLLSCRNSNVGGPDDEGDVCRSFREQPSTMLRKLKGPFADARAQVTYQEASLFGGPPVIAPVYEQAGRSIVDLYRVGFDVLPDGSTTHIVLGEQIGSRPVADHDPARPVFAAAPGRTDHVDVKKLTCACVAEVITNIGTVMQYSGAVNR